MPEAPSYSPVYLAITAAGDWRIVLRTVLHEAKEAAAASKRYINAQWVHGMPMREVLNTLRKPAAYAQMGRRLETKDTKVVVVAMMSPSKADMSPS